MTTDRKCYIRSVAQVSCQEPLSESWMESANICTEDFVRSVEPAMRPFVSPIEARRMSKILKRSVATGKTALAKAGAECPDAIITGTGMGCIDNSEKFLIDMARQGESCLKPTLFMQSTHNTISSLIAISLGCHGYNNTYSQGMISFESALLDAWLIIKRGKSCNILVGAHDETTPLLAKVLRKAHPEFGFISETSMSALVSGEPGAVEIESVEIKSNATPEEIASTLDSDRDTVLMLGVAGIELNDSPYKAMLSRLDFEPMLLQYKNLFGFNFSVSAMGLYAAYAVLESGNVPESLLFGNTATPVETPKRITIINYSPGTWSVIRLKHT